MKALLPLFHLKSSADVKNFSWLISPFWLASIVLKELISLCFQSSLSYFLKYKYEFFQGHIYYAHQIIIFIPSVVLDSIILLVRWEAISNGILTPGPGFRLRAPAIIMNSLYQDSACSSVIPLCSANLLTLSSYIILTRHVAIFIHWQVQSGHPKLVVYLPKLVAKLLCETHEE